MFCYAHDVYAVMVDGDYGDGADLLDDGALAFDDGLGAMSFVMPLMEMTCDDELLVDVNPACLIEDPLPLSSPFIPLLYLALSHPLLPLLLHSFTSSNLVLAPSTLAHPFLNLTLPLLH